MTIDSSEQAEALSKVITCPQVYSKWQADEDESVAELEAGQGVHFETAQDAIRWLLSDD